MRRFSFGVALAALPAFALSLMLAGCGGGKDTGPAGGGGGSDSEVVQEKELKVLEPGKGILKGKITLNGKPDLAALTKNLHDEMKKKDTVYCMKGLEKETTQFKYCVNEKGLLGNVFVWVIPDTGTFFKVTDQQLKDVPKQVETHQPHCAFLPHCLFHFSQYHPDPKNTRKQKPTGQIWVIHNDAEIGHNTNYKGGVKNKGENITLKAKSERKIDNLVPEKSPVNITCNIHTWMRGYMWVVDTPYYDISKSDRLSGKDKVEKGDAAFGTYEIKNLPVGKVRVLAWHEECGYLNKGKGKGVVVQILPEKATVQDFEAKAP